MMTMTIFSMLVLIVVLVFGVLCMLLVQQLNQDMEVNRTYDDEVWDLIYRSAPK